MRYTALALVVLITACASTSQVHPYRPKGYDGPAWQIAVHQDFGEISVLVDGEPVATGDASMWDGAGTVYGTHEDRKIRAECEPEYDYAGNVSGTDCRVYVDNELAANVD